jgi:hypothetical protein
MLQIIQHKPQCKITLCEKHVCKFKAVYSECEIRSYHTHFHRITLSCLSVALIHSRHNLGGESAGWRALAHKYYDKNKVNKWVTVHVSYAGKHITWVMHMFVTLENVSN